MNSVEALLLHGLSKKVLKPKLASSTREVTLTNDTVDLNEALDPMLSKEIIDTIRILGYWDHHSSLSLVDPLSPFSSLSFGLI